MEEAEPINHLTTTISMVRKFHEDGKYWDVQLQIGEKLFRCQRSLLAAISEYFDVMFSTDFRESNNSRDEPIILHEMDATAFKEIIDFIYTGEISVDDSNVFQLLFMNDFFRLRTPHVRNQCVKYVRIRSKKPVPIENALDLFSFACMKAEHALIDILTIHVCQHLYYYSKDANLLEISFENLNALLKFSKDYLLPLSGSQNVVLKIIHIWVNHNRKERRKYRRKLIENIRFSNVSSDYALSIVCRLENVADEVVNHPEDIKSAVAELETLRMGVEIDQADGDARLSARISFDVKSVRRMRKNQLKLSSHLTISNMLWKIRIRRTWSNNLGVFLTCCGENTCGTRPSWNCKTHSWSCSANAIFTLVSHKKGKENLVVELGHVIFSPRHPNWGFKEFLDWDDLIDPENGYITDTNSITLNAHVDVDVPFFVQKEFSIYD